MIYLKYNNENDLDEPYAWPAHFNLKIILYAFQSEEITKDYLIVTIVLKNPYSSFVSNSIKYGTSGTPFVFIKPEPTTI